MGHRRDVVAELKTKYDPIIIAREKGRCFLCSNPGRDVHEILSKSRFATKELSTCISPINMVLLCRAHHEQCQGISSWMGYLFRGLELAYGYQYDGTVFQWYYELDFTY